MSDNPPSRKRPRMEEPAAADPAEPPGRPDWTPLDEEQVSEVREGEGEGGVVGGESQAGDEGEGEDENKDMDEGEEEELIRDEDFWFEDGTVVLVAEGVEFRVYRGPLADHSPVFKDLFSEGKEDGEDRESNAGVNADLNVDLNTTSNAELNVDSNADSDATSDASSDSGCPTVRLTDSANDLRHILRVFLPNRDPACILTILPYFYESPTFDAISASIRLGTKYRMSRLVQHTLEYLKDYYPSSFDVWRNQTKGPPGFTARHAIGVVNLARLTGEDTLLPVALLTCCGLNEAIVRGCKREDGSREQLSLDDIGLCFRAKGKLIEAAVTMCLRICSWKHVAPKCANQMKAFHNLVELHSSRKGRKRLDASEIEEEGDACRIALRNATLDLPRRVGALCSGRAGTNLLLNFERFYGDVRKQLCKECWAMVQDRDLAERRATWNRLPDLLGITVDGWGQA